MSLFHGSDKHVHAGSVVSMKDPVNYGDINNAMTNHKRKLFLSGGISAVNKGGRKAERETRKRFNSKYIEKLGATSKVSCKVHHYDETKLLDYTDGDELVSHKYGLPPAYILLWCKYDKYRDIELDDTSWYIPSVGVTHQFIEYELKEWMSISYQLVETHRETADDYMLDKYGVAEGETWDENDTTYTYSADGIADQDTMVFTITSVGEDDSEIVDTVNKVKRDMVYRVPEYVRTFPDMEIVYTEIADRLESEQGVSFQYPSKLGEVARKWYKSDVVIDYTVAIVKLVNPIIDDQIVRFTDIAELAQPQKVYSIVYKKDGDIQYKVIRYDDASELSFLKNTKEVVMSPILPVYKGYKNVLPMTSKNTGVAVTERGVEILTKVKVHREEWKLSSTEIEELKNSHNEAMSAELYSRTIRLLGEAETAGDCTEQEVNVLSKRLKKNSVQTSRLVDRLLDHWQVDGAALVGTLKESEHIEDAYLMVGLNPFERIYDEYHPTVTQSIKLVDDPDGIIAEVLYNWFDGFAEVSNEYKTVNIALDKYRIWYTYDYKSEILTTDDLELGKYKMTLGNTPVTIANPDEDDPYGDEVMNSFILELNLGLGNGKSRRLSIDHLTMSHILSQFTAETSIAGVHTSKFWGLSSFYKYDMFFVIPQEQLDALRFKEWAIINERSIYMYAHSHQVIRLKWYQKTIFGIILIIIAIVACAYGYCMLLSKLQLLLAVTAYSVLLQMTGLNPALVMIFTTVLTLGVGTAIDQAAAKAAAKAAATKTVITPQLVAHTTSVTIDTSMTSIASTSSIASGALSQSASDLGVSGLSKVTTAKVAPSLLSKLSTTVSSIYKIADPLIGMSSNDPVRSRERQAEEDKKLSDLRREQDKREKEIERRWERAKSVMNPRLADSTPEEFNMLFNSNMLTKSNPLYTNVEWMIQEVTDIEAIKYKNLKRNMV